MYFRFVKKYYKDRALLGKAIYVLVNYLNFYDLVYDTKWNEIPVGENKDENFDKII